MKTLFARNTFLTRATGIAALAVLATSALAWKPKTHIYLAKLAWEDAKDGFVSVYRVNHDTGEVLGKVGDYKVREDLRQAILAHEGKYLAGVLGPDAYPDIVTGQSIIHPENVPALKGSNSWLEHIWTQGMQRGPSVKAFTAGYLTHAAGDMFAHTYVNHFAGGDFKMGANAARHLVFEGYIGKKTPGQAKYDPPAFSIDNDIATFVYDVMINARPGNKLFEELLVVGVGEDGSANTAAAASIPLIFSQLRALLDADRARMAVATNPIERAANTPKIAYLNAWIADIDAGLKQWPHYSHRIARLLVWPQDETLESRLRDRALQEIWQEWTNTHMLSMMGLPDGVGYARQTVQNLFQPYSNALSDAVHAIVMGGVDYVFQKSWGVTYGQFKDMLFSPENYYNQVLGPGSPGSPPGVAITLQQFNANELKQNATEEWVLNQFPPAYNTVLMSKLVLVERDEINRLVRDLKAPALTTNIPTKTTTTFPVRSTLTLPTPTLATDNVMLGFNHKLDGDSQWKLNASKLIFQTAGVYDEIFIRQKGEHEPSANPAPEPVSRSLAVVISSVAKIDNGIDPIGGPDFYPAVKFNGASALRKPAVIDSDTATPNWTLSKTVFGDFADVEIAIMDEDGGLLGDDDVCDINRTAGKRTVKLRVNLRTGAISGDFTSSTGQTITSRGDGDSDRVEVKFKITMS